MIALPVLGALLLFRLLRGRLGLVPASVGAEVSWGAVLLVMTETLSLAGKVTPAALAFTWAALDGLLVLVLYRRGERPAVPGPRGEPADIWHWGPVALVLALTLVVALAAPPNTEDALTYHMSRVAMWAQHRSVAYYPTATPRQLYLARSLPWLVGNATRPLLPVGAGATIASVLTVPRTRQYLSRDTAQAEPYARAASLLRAGCDRIGLTGPDDGWWYPLLLATRDDGRPIRFRSVFVENATAFFAPPTRVASGDGL